MRQYKHASSSSVTKMHNRHHQPRQLHPKSKSIIFLTIASLFLILTLPRKYHTMRKRIPARPSIPIPASERAPRPDVVAQNDNTTYESSIPGMRPRTILSYVPRGGVGNQIYFLAEAMYLARRAQLDLVLPLVLGRKLNASMSPLNEPADKFWDAKQVQNALAGGRVRSSLDACFGVIDIVYLVSRSRTRPQTTVNVPRRVRDAVCRNASHACEEWFTDTEVVTRALPLDADGDMRFVEEVGRLRSRVRLRSGKPIDRAVCVVVDGHSYNRGGLNGHEYLYSFMHYIESTDAIQDIARTYPRNLSVLHIRYDERECIGSDVDLNKVCIRTQQTVGLDDTVYWVSMGDFVKVVVQNMKECNSERLYIASSPYMPDVTVEKLKERFNAVIKVVNNVDERVGANVKNFVERQLAIDAACFIGDYGSTWSGTVYYKRRTMGKTTQWSNVLLGRHGNGLGFYQVDDALAHPSRFEGKEEST